MRERCQQWSAKIKSKPWWVLGAIAAPVLLGTAGWLWWLPERRLPPEDGERSPHEIVALAHPHRDTLMRGMGAIAAVAGGVLLVLNSRQADSNRATANLMGAELSGANLTGADFTGAELSGADLSRAELSDANLSGANLSGAELSGANLSGANLSGANLGGAELSRANLSGADLSGAELRYVNLSGADLRYANLSGASFRHANLSGADLNCTLLSGANFSDANLSGALLFFINLREVQNLEPLQLEAKPSPFLCNVALPAYSQQPRVNPNRACDRIPQLLSARYQIPLEEAQGIVDEARQHQWS